MTLHGSRSWQNRRVAVYSLGQIGTKAAQIMTLSFLYDRDPRARLEAVASVDVNLELACRRLLQTAVNDNSQVVRTAGFLRLTESSIDEYRQEGYKGVRDEALGVRLALLAAFVKNPNEGQRQAIRIAVVDREPIVRAAALEALAAQPGPVQIEEFSNVLQDQDPRVRAALEALGKAKNLALP